jgi:hemoglobin/transferrin/lactoferrin receptor protein
MPIRTRAIVPSTLLLALASGVLADEPKPDELPIFDELDRIVVTATLNQRAQKDVAGDVTVIDALEIDRRQMQGLDDLLRYEPGVSVTGGATGGNRFGIGGVSIRGLGGNRVRMEIDGIAVPDAFSIGSFSSAGRDLVDVDALKRVEIVRGAASSLYGSDALGGVVSYVTKDPDDYLGPDGGRFLSGKLLYDSADRGSAESGTWAGGNAEHGAVVVATHRDGSALANMGDVDSADASRTRPNPQETKSNAVLAKYVHTAPSGRIDRIAIDGEHADVDTDVLSSVTNAPTTALAGHDVRERERFSFGQEIPFASFLADSVDWKAYWQKSRTTQDTFEDRAATTTADPTERMRRFGFDQRVAGAEATFRKSAATGAAEHAITYGVDLSRTRTEEERNGYQRNVLTGEITHVVLPDTFPVHDFPPTDTTNAALFAQDEIKLAGGRLSLVPGVRFDYYKLDPRKDPVYSEVNPVAPAVLGDTSASPKLAAIWRFDETFSAYAQYAHGFRAPPYNDVNLGFTNLAFGYTSIPNPDLEPETSNGLEIGLRGGGRYGYFSLAAYENRYRDFIESEAVVDVDPETGFITFQSINLSRVTIRGFEARYGLDFGAFSDALAGWSLKGSLATARGDDDTANQPLASIEPAKAVLGIAFDRERWGAELVGTLVERKDRLPKPTEDDPTVRFAPPGYATLDLYSHCQVHPQVEIYAALANITDRKYWDWGIVGGLAESSTIDRYSAPGRAARVGIRATF